MNLTILLVDIDVFKLKIPASRMYKKRNGNSNNPIEIHKI